MTGTDVVLVSTLISGLLLGPGLLVATFLLARFFGQGVKKVSWSFRHGYTAEFFPPKKDLRAGHKHN